MSLPWYCWIALAACAILFVADCGVFFRNAKRAEFGLLNVLVMFGELVGIVGMIAYGLR